MTISVEVRLLASGSAANACLVRAGGDALLIDAGLPYPQLVARMHDAGVAVDDLRAVLLSHEHGDHVRALPELRARHPGVPVYATPGTARGVHRRTGAVVDRAELASEARLTLGAWQVTPFAVAHDAAEPVGFRLTVGDTTLGIATDLGAWDATTRRMLRGCRLLVVEANHDPALLAAGPYPAFLKRRVASRRGHLSNPQAASLVAAVASDRLEHVLLAHLSATNNSPERAEAAVAMGLRQRGHRVPVAAALHHQATPPRRLTAGPAAPEAVQPTVTAHQPRLF